MPIFLFFIIFGIFILITLISVFSSKSKAKAKKDKPQGDFTVTSDPDKTMFFNDSNKTGKVTDSSLEFSRSGKLMLPFTVLNLMSTLNRIIPIPRHPLLIPD